MTEWREAVPYIELAFSIQKYIPNYVDAYFGPHEIRQSAENHAKLSQEVLSSRVEKIISSTSQDKALSEARKGYLLGQLNGMQTTLEILQGKTFEIGEETRRLFGITPLWIDEGIFTQVHSQLDELLPGKGPLYERAEYFRKKTVIPADKIEPLARSISDELRRLTRAFIPLPETENCQYYLVNNQPCGIL